jgi:predicted thioesterase
VGREVVRGILDGRMEVVGEDVEVGHQAGAVCGDGQLYRQRRHV